MPTVGALWLLSDVKPLSLKALRGCSIQSALAGIQVPAQVSFTSPAVLCDWETWKQQQVLLFVKQFPMLTADIAELYRLSCQRDRKSPT